ncbi:MAG: FkbM family methyltransferase, partial [Kiloniellales bacterium]
MDEIAFARALPLRRPARVLSLPWPIRLRASAKGEKAILFAKLVYSIAYSHLGLSGDGLLEFGAELRRALFDARDTGFGPFYRSEPFEPDTSALIDRLVGDEDCFYDIGANCGYYCLLIGGRPGFAGQIEAFEPMPATFAHLASLVADLDLGELVACHCIALSDRSGSVRMAADSKHSMLAHVVPHGGMAVPARRLDDLDLRPPSLIKLDVEGHELAVIDGGRALLARAKPLIVLESRLGESSPGKVLAPLAALRELGYRLYRSAWWTRGAAKGLLTLAPLEP